MQQPMEERENENESSLLNSVIQSLNTPLVSAESTSSHLYPSPRMLFLISVPVIYYAYHNEITLNLDPFYNHQKVIFVV